MNIILFSSPTPTAYSWPLCASNFRVEVDVLHKQQITALSTKDSSSRNQQSVVEMTVTRCENQHHYFGYEFRQQNIECAKNNRFIDMIMKNKKKKRNGTRYLRSIEADFSLFHSKCDTL